MDDLTGADCRNRSYHSSPNRGIARGGSQVSSPRRWLDRAVSQRVLLREGTGRKNVPFRYWLPEDEERLKQPPWQKEREELIERMNRLGSETAGLR
jgi:hypothetical protein